MLCTSIVKPFAEAMGISADAGRHMPRFMPRLACGLRVVTAASSSRSARAPGAFVFEAFGEHMSKVDIQTK